MMQRRITKDLLIYLPGKVLPALAAFITLPIYTRLFSPAEFGNYVLATAASEFLLLATVVGLGQAAVRFFSAYQLKSSLPSYFAMIFFSVGGITLAVAGVCAILMLLLRSLIPAELSPLLWAALVLFVVTAYFSILSDVLRGQEKSRWYSIFSIGSTYGGIIFGLILVLVFKMGLVGLIWGQALGLLLPIFPLVWLTTRSVQIRPADLRRSDIRQIWAFALPFTLGNTAYWSLNLSDRYLIDLFRGSHEVGLYSVANKISWRTIQLLVSLFFLVPPPIISRLWEERGRKATEEALTAFTRMFFLIVIPAVVGLAAVAAPLVRLLADEAYFAGYAAIWLVACGSMALGLSDLGSSGSLVANRTRLIARNQVAAAGVNLALNFFLIPALGFMGAALSTLLSFALLAGLQAFSSARFLTWRWPLMSLLRVLAASAAMFTSVYLVQAALRSDTTIWQAANLLLSIAAGALIYGLALLALGEIRLEQLLRIFRERRRQAPAAPVTDKTGSL